MVDVIFQIIIAAFIIRYLCERNQLIRFNPVARKLAEFTEPLLMPVRDVVKKLLQKTTYRPQQDPSSLILACLIALFTGIALTRGSFARGFMVGSFWFFCATWVNVMIYSIFLVVIASWLQTPQHQPVVQIASACHDFVMKPLRKHIPPLGMLDFTPVIALFVLYLIKNQLLAPLAFGG